MTTLNDTIAAQIAARLVANGYPTCTFTDVYEVYRHGSVAEGTVSPDYDENLTDQIIDQLDSYGIKAP